MTTHKMADKDIERMMDIIGDGELSAEAQERLHRKACGRFMRACGKWPIQPLCSATQMGSRAQCVRNVLPPLVDMPNDDVSPVDVGTDPASQRHIIEMDNGHSKLAFKRRKAFRGPVYDHLGCDGRYVQKSIDCLGSLGVIAIIPSERQQRKAGLASDEKLNRLFRVDI